MRPLYSVLFCLNIVLGCQTKTFDDPISFLYKNTVPLLKTEEVVQKMHYQEPLLLDTRSRSEFSVSHLPGAQLIEYEDFKPYGLKSSYSIS
jgi:predicted sulfurtransferase